MRRKNYSQRPPICLQELAPECANQHVHVPWGVTPHGFATVKYPIDLRRRRAQLVHDSTKPTYKCPKVSLLAHPDKPWHSSPGGVALRFSTFHLNHLSSSAKLKESISIGDATLPMYMHSRIFDNLTQDTCQDGGDNTIVAVVGGGLRSLLDKQILPEGSS